MRQIDTDLYFRMAHNIINGPKPSDEADSSETSDDHERNDVASLARLLWHHGVETLVMLLGAYIQAPKVAHAYMLKCQTNDAVKIADLLLQGVLPKYHRLNSKDISVVSLLTGIHLHAGWTDIDEHVEQLGGALRSMLVDFTSEKHRWEYNSIKHGLRASHGAFTLAFGLQSEQGTPAPPEAMEVIGQSRDSSFFNVAKPLTNTTKQEAKRHFHTERVTVAWTLEKVLIELQLLSTLLHNVVSAIRVATGGAPDSVTYNRLVDDGSLWANYRSMQNSSVPTLSFSISVKTKQGMLPSENEIFDSYRE